MGLRDKLQAARTERLAPETQSGSSAVPQIAEDLLSLLREVGFPPMLIGAFRYGLKGISEEQVRQMCLRVSVGMAHIYIGGDVKESLKTTTLLDDEALLKMLSELRKTESLQELPEIPALETASNEGY